MSSSIVHIQGCPFTLYLYEVLFNPLTDRYLFFIFFIGFSAFTPLFYLGVATSTPFFSKTNWVSQNCLNLMKLFWGGSEEHIIIHNTGRRTVIEMTSSGTRPTLPSNFSVCLCTNSQNMQVLVITASTSRACWHILDALVLDSYSHFHFAT